MSFDVTPVVGPSLLEAVKVAVRVSPTLTVYDGELANLISAAKLQLTVAGVSTTVLAEDPLDSLVQSAIIVYVKAMFGMDNPEAERFMASFESLAVTLALASEYREDESS